MTTDASAHSPLSPDQVRALLEGRWHDPFALLGPHQSGKRWTITALIPGAEKVEALGGPMGGLHAELARLDPEGLFHGEVPAGLAREPYRLRAARGDAVWEFEDPYRFGPVLGELDEHLISEGAHRRLWKRLGAHPMTHEGVDGVHFAVWAPAARRVSLVGDFNVWDGRRNVMRARGGTGVWEIFMPGMRAGAVYKYEIVGQDGHAQPLKADPVGFGSEHPPATASVVRDLREYEWRDAEWMAAREARNRRDAPISIYEAHLGSWKRVPEEGDRPLSYLELAERLVPYVADMGFTHIELMPVTEHPFDGSWGYQPIGMFAPTIRHGAPEEFRQFVEACHRAGLGLILDWVPAHFPTDAHGLAQFDGTALYEHADPREGFHHDWNTLIYNYGRREVSNFLVANALYWLGEYHIDGLRVDAVASMLYRDYSRNEGEWIPNQFGGRENLEAIEFLRRANMLAYEENPGVMMIAEESTAFPGVSAPVDAGGLGFGYKWNMGWMNDTLDYISRDPIHRRHHHHQMTFGLHYGFTENFILPISHDEVVHGKGSMIAKMPGWGDDKFAHLRAYYGFMWGHPGKKLLFQGQEFAQGAEWRHDRSLDWHLLDHPQHRGVRDWVRDLNRVYCDHPALHRRDCEGSGFCWLELNADEISVYAWMRFGEEGDAPVIVVCNFTPIDRPGFRVGAPKGGKWREILNSDGAQYGGRGQAQPAPIEAERKHWNHQDWSFEFHLPGLSTVMFRAEG